MSTKWYWLLGAGLIAGIALFGSDTIEKDVPGGKLVFGTIHGALAAADASIGALTDVTAVNLGTTGLLASGTDNQPGGSGMSTTPLGYGQRG